MDNYLHKPEINNSIVSPDRGDVRITPRDQRYVGGFQQIHTR